MKCCTHHVLPSGHVIPFCAYNVLYRDGHVPLPELAEQLSVSTLARNNVTSGRPIGDLATVARGDL
jgi:hypothetical protein